MLKRICLFLGLNLLIITCVSVLCNFLGLKPYISSTGLNLEILAIFCLIWGMVGSLVSLLLSKKIAKWMLSVQIIKITENSSENEIKLVNIVKKISTKAKITKLPEVGIFSSTGCNAFATGATRNSALIAVSSGLLDTLANDELEAVVAHEISHITSGDMVTMTLLQGVVNAFVMFLSRVCAYLITNLGGKNSRRSGSFLSFYLFTILFEMIFLSLGSVLLFFVSRKREYAADKGGASLVGRDKMIKALKALEASAPLSKQEIKKQKEFSSMMIKETKPASLSRLFSTHPTIKERISYLESLTYEFWRAESSSTDFA